MPAATDGKIPGADPRTGPSYSLGHRIRRQLWRIVWAIFFRPSPIPFHAWRAFLLRAFGARIAKGARVYPTVQVWAPWNLLMAPGSVLGDGVICYSMDVVSIGERAMVSQRSHLCAGTHDHTVRHLPLVTAPVVIGADAWVCAEAFVGPGVTIGDGTVVGARSVVTKSMPAWTVCAGHPCRPLKARVFTDGFGTKSEAVS